MLIFPILLAAFFSSTSARHYSQMEKEFVCPFTHPNGTKCLRNPDRYDQMESMLELNFRPDIDNIKNATEVEKKSDRQCCYEVVCLEDCGILYTQINSYYADKLPELGYELIREYPSFFNRRSRGLLEHYNKRSEPLKDNWRIILLHFFNAKHEWEQAKLKQANMKKLFG